ncbi:MAG: sulfotransferase [Halanaerobiales bacterium]|nr:sulfotransferase [Halanaerobiales bacterium]
MDKNQKVIVVLGMHRSGTSMTAGILTKLGVDMGKKLLGGGRGNPKGHFEDLEFLSLNRDILRTVGGNWQNPPDKEVILVQKERFKERIRELFEKRTSEIWGWKDPRTSLTIELYMPFLFNPYFIVCYRDSLAIAQSLRQRENMEIETGINLAKIYQKRISNFFEKYPNLLRMELSYDNVVAKSKREINRIINFLNLKVSNEQIKAAKKIILSPNEKKQLQEMGT